jgi:DNA mismatch repair protein MSH5
MLNLSLGENANLPYILERRPSSEFNYELAKRKLANIDLSPEGHTETAIVMAGDHESASSTRVERDAPHGGYIPKLLRISGLIDLDSRVTVISSTPAI